MEESEAGEKMNKISGREK
uniref:Uncharacterized protein n=1 Tax=Arundo donax TaxID=35708 RepID=A0A0A9TRP4_ARUDO